MKTYKVYTENGSKEVMADGYNVQKGYANSKMVHFYFWTWQEYEGEKARYLVDIVYDVVSIEEIEDE
jgi:hypothetical protein